MFCYKSVGTEAENWRQSTWWNGALRSRDSRQSRGRGSFLHPACKYFPQHQVGIPCAAAMSCVSGTTTAAGAGRGTAIS